MEFFGRDNDLRLLHKIREQSKTMARMTVITGRRRIGKTRLILESLKGEQYLYFFVSRADEKLLCQEFSDQAAAMLGINFYDPVLSFKALFGRLLEYAEQKHLNLVIDEFQEFTRVNPTVFSDIQNLWDRHKEQVKMNLIFSGSVRSLMLRIFEDAKEPLFGRATARFYIRPFSLSTLRKAVNKYGGKLSNKDMLGMYAITGGVPKYVEQLVDERAFTFSAMFDEIFREQSFFLEEGRYILVQEFGKDYATYFSVLALIASGKTSRQQIESVLQRPVGGYLTQLEKDYQLINRLRPILSKPGTLNVRYFIEDNFLRFWFRFIYRNQAAVNSLNFKLLREIFERDGSTFLGLTLERLIREQLRESMEFSHVGNYWKRGNKNEIDVIAYNELTKKAIIGEVKMNPENISLDVLRLKAQEISKELGGYAIEYQGYSLEDVLTEPSDISG
jgi:AAA+ ATPase superfamily predicted ATPase